MTLRSVTFNPKPEIGTDGSISCPGKINRSSKTPERLPRFTTLSDVEIKGLYTPDDIKEMDYSEAIGLPGVYPFTRGVQPSMYRGRLWTMRMFSGLGGPEETNQRFHYLLEHGETGLSIAFHYPTLMGYDSDSPMARGEIGKCGVAIDTLRDMEILFEGIPLDKVTTSMTINPPASILLAMYLVLAEKQGISSRDIGGTIQNDMLKEFIAQKTFMLPPKPSLRIIVDTIEYLHHGRFPGGIRSVSVATISVRREPQQSRNSHSRWPMALPMWRRQSREASRSMILPQDSPSFSIPTSTSSKRLQSSERPGGCGQS